MSSSTPAPAAAVAQMHARRRRATIRGESLSAYAPPPGGTFEFCRLAAHTARGMQRATRVLRKAAHSHGHSDGNKYGGACCAALHAIGSGEPFTLLLLAPTPSLPPLPGFHAPHVDPFHQNMATIIGATMWFWIFYRFREDGGVLLVRACLAQRGPCPQVRQPRPRPSLRSPTPPPTHAHPPTLTHLGIAGLSQALGGARA